MRAARRSKAELGELLSVIEPATEAVLEQIPRAGIAEVDAAVTRAREAYPAWRALSPGERARTLRALADALADHQEELAVLEARNVGKPIGDSRGEMAMVVDTFGYYAGAPERLLARCTEVPSKAQETLDALFADGARVVAVASRDALGLTSPTPDEEHGLHLEGFLTFIDRPKIDAGAAIAELTRIGIAVKIITGDNEIVTRKICLSLPKRRGFSPSSPQRRKPV